MRRQRPGKVRVEVAACLHGLRSVPEEVNKLGVLRGGKSDRPHSLRGYGWGNNSAGGLGVGSVARALMPVGLALPEGTVDVQGGSDFTVALTSSGQVWAWGGNAYGQLGNGSSTRQLTPHLVELPRSVSAAAISVGADHVLVLSRTGSVYGWGRNLHGQVGNGTTTDCHEPVKLSIGKIAKL